MNHVFWTTYAQGRLGTMPRPVPMPTLKQSMLVLRDQGVDVLVSALPEDSNAMLGLIDEAEAADAVGIQFYAFPIKDRMVPPLNEGLLRFADTLLDHMNDGKGVVTHCYAGIGRATLIAAMTLIRAGQSTEKSLRLISEARGMIVPDTREQRDWLKRFEQRFGKRSVRG